MFDSKIVYFLNGFILRILACHKWALKITIFWNSGTTLNSVSEFG
jgi:hypothetical protein